MGFQLNYLSWVEYNWQNQSILLDEKEENGYESDMWLTFIQARSKKLKIKKGSKGVTIFKWYWYIEEKDKKGKTKMRSISNWYVNVFNLDQTEALKTK
jgi:antirestriction protein ArdC